MVKLTGAMQRLTPEQQAHIRQVIAEGQINAEARRWNREHLPRKAPMGRKSWGALDNIPSPEWEVETR